MVHIAQILKCTEENRKFVRKQIDRGLIMYYYNKQVERMFGKGEEYGKQR